MHGHESQVVGLSREARELLTEDHFASDKIQDASQKLQKAWQALNEKADHRTKSLNESLSVQQVKKHKCCS